MIEFETVKSVGPMFHDFGILKRKRPTFALI